MKTIYDHTTRAALIRRIHALNENSTSLWGKMNVYQMLKHCVQWEEMILGKQKHNRSFLGRLFGKIAMKDLLKDELPMKRSLPTLPQLRVVENDGNVMVEKEKWIALIEEHANSSDIEFVHSFFGKITRDQAGQLAYKHTDHHLRQFNC